jgi:hypothetical protein
MGYEIGCPEAAYAFTAACSVCRVDNTWFCFASAAVVVGVPVPAAAGRGAPTSRLATAEAACPLGEAEGVVEDVVLTNS